MAGELIDPSDPNLWDCKAAPLKPTCTIWNGDDGRSDLQIMWASPPLDALATRSSAVQEYGRMVAAIRQCLGQVPEKISPLEKTEDAAESDSEKGFMASIPRESASTLWLPDA